MLVKKSGNVVEDCICKRRIKADTGRSYDNAYKNEDRYLLSSSDDTVSSWRFTRSSLASLLWSSFCSSLYM